MRRMTFYQPRGMRYDTSVPARCTASDLQLEEFGRAACPRASRLGGGQIKGLWMGRIRSTFQMDMFNNAGEQVVVARTPYIATVIRGRFSRDQSSVVWSSPTCWPTPPPGARKAPARRLASRLGGACGRRCRSCPQPDGAPTASTPRRDSCGGEGTRTRPRAG